MSAADIGPAWRVDGWITGGSRPHKPEVDEDELEEMETNTQQPRETEK